MKLNPVHSFEVASSQFQEIQEWLAEKMECSSSLPFSHLKSCAGVDLAYWEKNGVEQAACSIVVTDMEGKKVMEKVSGMEAVKVPYIPGYLAFRELPLILETVKQLTVEPDVFLFDGNGYLHPRHMGIASHASFFLNKPTIGVAKNYFKLNETNFNQPASQKGAFTDIIINDDVYGRVLRTREDVKPLFVSCGNFINLEMATAIVMRLVHKESRMPVPLRLADMEAKKLKTLAKR